MTGILSGNLLGVGVATVSLTPSSVAAATSAEQTFTVAGLNAGDYVGVNAPSSVAGVGVVGARASAAGTIAITFMNATAGALTPASGSYRIHWMRAESVQVGVVA